MSRLTNGIIFVVLGASSYGMLSTFVKLAYRAEYTTGEVIISQYVWGIAILAVCSFLYTRGSQKATRKELIELCLAGTFGGITSAAYYTCVHFIDASVAVVLLMQSVWMGVVLESIQRKSFPSKDKLAAVVAIIVGTVFATNTFAKIDTGLDFRGVGLGLAAGLAFSFTMLSTASIATALHPVKRSLVMLTGGFVIVLAYAAVTQLIPYYFGTQLLTDSFTQSVPFHTSIFLNYGLLVAVFGTVLPPVFMNKGFPIVGTGFGSILSSIELPFAMTIACVVLNEKVVALQVVGVLIILGAVVLLNVGALKKSKA